MDTTAVVLPYTAYILVQRTGQLTSEIILTVVSAEENKIEFCASMIGSMTKYKSYILVNGGEYLSFNKGM